MYAIVDVETTGSYASGNSITEIAVCVHDGKKPLSWFESLVRPGKQIPYYITGLTGITNEMVAAAPTFAEILPKIEELTRGCVFVAHHVHFDYTFVKAEFEHLGKSFNRNKLCTVRLSRKLIPGLSSYSLGRLCAHLQIPHENAHRAMGDVKATVQLFEMLMGLDNEQHINKVVKRNSGEAILPAHLPKEQFDDLPEVPGVYYFKDREGKIIYIGKAVNIKQRVRSHFTGADRTPREEAFKRQIHEIRYRKTGSELIALLLEDSEIRKYWPRYNKAQKTPSRNYGIYRYEDLLGHYRLGVSKAPSANGALQTFGRLSEAKDALGRLVDDFGLCPSLCGMGSFCERCMLDPLKCAAVDDKEAYNERVEKAIAQFRDNKKRCAILGQGRDFDEQSVVLLDGDKYLGFGFLKVPEEKVSFETIAESIERHPESTTVRNIINKQLRDPENHRLLYF